jgi:S1/P1 Nuclease
MKRTFVALFLISLVSVNGFAYGDRGHQLVGAVADRRLAQNDAVAKKLQKLLPNLTLEEAAILPDTIKNFQCGVQLTGDSVNRQLQAFVNANCVQRPRHADFHFTDVPVFKAELYGAGTVGRESFDIVHMIPFCIQVLKGKIPETNNRKITKTIAIILLAHYLGDIHQPLHVGAEFFNKQGHAFQPVTPTGAFSDRGGNQLMLSILQDDGTFEEVGNLHSYWDNQTVDNAFGQDSNETVAQKLASNAPANWKLNGDVRTWAVQIANDLLPTAREAHQRLRFDGIKLDKQKHLVKSGNARERNHGPDVKSYADWSADVVRKEIQIGGWRLAALLEAVL